MEKTSRLSCRRWTSSKKGIRNDMNTNTTKPTTTTKKTSAHYIQAIRKYLSLRTEVDDLSHGAQMHLAYLVMWVKMDGTSSVGYAELQRLRLSRKTIAAQNRRFQELG